MGLGVSHLHIDAIHHVAKQQNFFLFVRPTEDDSLRLIEAGYATKSMDIHDKSSNWGPMAGFVPCDAAFSKAPSKNPDDNLHAGKHGLAVPVQLDLAEEVLRQHIGTKITSVVCRIHIDEHHQSVAPKVHAWFQTPPYPNVLAYAPDQYDVYLPNGKPAKVTDTIGFAIGPKPKNKVWWFRIDPNVISGKGQSCKVTLHPLLVWAYRVQGKLTPVTGDYDIWALVPHISTLKSVGEHVLVSIDRGAHGASAASAYFKRISNALNRACYRADNTVFNHGAEAQNFGFTQKHDEHILMFPPGGVTNNVRKISIAQMADVLAEIQRAGYLVLLNRQWTVARPKLMGKDLPEYFKWLMLDGMMRFSTHRTKRQEERDKEKAAKGANAPSSAPPSAEAAPATTRKPRTANPYVNQMWRGIAQAAVAQHRKNVSEEFEPARLIMVEWYQTLKQKRGMPISHPVLWANDYPDQYRIYQEHEAAMRHLQIELEDVAASEMSGGGENATEVLQARVNELGAKLIAYWTGRAEAGQQ